MSGYPSYSNNHRRTQSFDLPHDLRSPSSPAHGEPPASGSSRTSPRVGGGSRRNSQGEAARRASERGNEDGESAAASGPGRRSAEYDRQSPVDRDSRGSLGAFGGYLEAPKSPQGGTGARGGQGDRAGYGAGAGGGAGAGAGLYDTKLVSQTLAQPSTSQSTISNSNVVRGTSSPRPSSSSARASQTKLPPPLRSSSSNSTSAAPNPSANVAKLTAGPSDASSSASPYPAGGARSRFNSRANSASTPMTSGSYTVGPTTSYPSGNAVPPSVLLRAGSASIAPDSYTQATGHSPPRSIAASHNSSADSGTSRRTRLSTTAHPVPNYFGSGSGSGTGTISAPISRGSFTHGTSTPLVPALSLTAATPSAPGPGSLLATIGSGGAGGAGGAGRPHSPAMSATFSAHAALGSTLGYGGYGEHNGSAGPGTGSSGSAFSSGSAGSAGSSGGSISAVGPTTTTSSSVSGATASTGAGSAPKSSLSASAALLQAQGEFTRNAARSIRGALEHSSPNSPWSQLTVHALPVFAGSVVKTSMENLNRLCSLHITATTQRAAPSKVTAVLITDLREFIASGMLTLKTRLEGDPATLVERMSETWFFFWTRVLGYIQGAFLPFSKLQNTPTPSSPLPHSLIPVRQLLLSGFLYHVLVPSLPALLSLLSTPEDTLSVPPSSSATSMAHTSAITDIALKRTQRMALILSSQASYSAIRPLAAGEGTTKEDALAIAATVDQDVRDQLDDLAGLVKWRMDRLTAGAAGSSVHGKAPGQGGAQSTNAGSGGVSRTASVIGRRRKGWRASITPDSSGFSGMAYNSARSGNSNTAAASFGLGKAGRQASDMTSHTHTSGTTSNQSHGQQGEASASRRWGPPGGHDTEDDYTQGGFEPAYGYEYDEDEEETIPAQSRNASIALGRLRQYSRAHDMGEDQAGYAGHEGAAVGGEGRSEGDGADTAASTLTATGTFRLGQAISAGHDGAAVGDGDEMTPTPGWAAGEMARMGSDASGDARIRQRA